jgi:hypothetical protein
MGWRRRRPDNDMGVGAEAAIARLTQAIGSGVRLHTDEQHHAEVDGVV